MSSFNRDLKLLAAAKHNIAGVCTKCCEPLTSAAVTASGAVAECCQNLKNPQKILIKKTLFSRI